MTLYQRSQPDIYTPRFTRVLVSSSVSLDEIISHSPSLSCVARDRVSRNVRSGKSRYPQRKTLLHDCMVRCETTAGKHFSATTDMDAIKKKVIAI